MYEGYIGLFVCKKCNNRPIAIPGESKKRPAFERLLLPEYISNDILQYLII